MSTSLEKLLLLACSKAKRAEVSSLLVEGANPNSEAATEKWDGTTPLHYACQHGWFDVAKQLIESYQSKPDIRDRHGKTPLHYACRYEHTHTRVLIEFLATICDPNVADKNGNTPLHEACQFHCLSSTKSLLQNEKCDPNYVNNSGLTPLQVVYRYTWRQSQTYYPSYFLCSYVDILCELIQHGAHCSSQDLNTFDCDGNTALHTACLQGNLTNVQCLLQTGKCDPNYKSEHSKLTPLLVTPVKHSSIISELFQHGANPNSVDENGDTVLHRACHDKDRDTVKFTLAVAECDLNSRNKSGMTPLHVAIHYTRINYDVATLKNTETVVFELIQHGAKVNIADGDGNTPLHHACKHGMLKVAQCLLRAPKCDPNIKNSNGLTPLQLTHCLFFVKDTALLIKELVDHGADPNVVDSHGNTLLHLACIAEDKNVVKGLLETGKCDLNHKNKAGETQLHANVLMNVSILNVLIQQGSYQSLQNEDGDTPLHDACQRGLLEVVQCILQAPNCDPNAKNLEQLTPLQVTPPKYFAVIKELVQHGANPNVIDRDGNTPLHIACSNGKTNYVRCLLTAAKCDLNRRNKAGLTPLQVTSPLYSYIIKELIDHGADPKVVDSDGNTPLHRSCLCGNLMSATYLLKSTTYSCDANRKNNAGLTPLQVTPSNCHVLASNLLEYIAIQDVNIDEDTVLHTACREGMVDVIKNRMKQFSQHINSQNKAGLTPIQVVPPLYASIIWELVQQGANPNVINVIDGETPLHKACFEEKLEYVEYLLKTAKCDPDIKNRDGLTPLQVTASWNTSIISTLVSHGANPNAVDRYGDTPLHKACHNESFNAVKLLLEMKGCDPNIKNKAGKAPIQVTTLWNKKIIKLLLKHGATPNTTDNEGNTQLHKACHAGSLDIVKCFLSTPNCDPNIKNSTGLTPLQVTSPEHFKIIRKLVQNGANPKVVDNEGNTPLHHACSHGKLNSVQFLLETAKCDPSITNNAGLTPLNLTDPKHIEIIQALVEHGANPNTTDKDGNTLLHNACYYGRIDTVKYLLEEAKCKPATKNKAGLTPLQITPPEFIEIIRELVKHGANPQDVYKTLGRSLKSPLQSPIKVFVVGDSGVGKSTLTAALQQESSFFTRTFMSARKVTGVDQKTAGVIPYEFESKEFGYATLYDFAGQREFYGSHAALMENAIQHSPPIILLVVDLSENEEIINQKISYWFTFLENQCTSVISEPHIIIVGSHADVLKTRGEDPDVKARVVKSGLPHSSFVFVRVITMDCQYSDSPGISELRQCLKTSCNALRTNATINFNSHCFYIYLLDKFKGIAAVTVKKIQNRTKIEMTQAEIPDSVMSFIPSSLHALCQICKELNDRGHLLYLKDSETIENSWVVIDKVALLSQVTGTIFAPEGFKQHSILTQCKCSTGVVPLSNIVKQFSKHNPTMLIGFLSCLEVCHEISDEEILLLITREHQTCMLNRPLAGSHDRYYLFPALVSLNVPSTVWEPNDSQFAHHSGWMLQCSNNSFFTPRFLQVLLLRLAFCFPLSPSEQDTIPAFQKICSIWKNGLFWGNKLGVETLVEVISDNKVVVLLMRCDQSSLIELLKLRSHIIKKVLRAASEFCSRVDTIESFIDPSKIEQYPLRPVSQLKLFDLRNVCHTAIDSKPLSVLCTTGTIPFEKLLLFEPYAGLGVSALNQIFNDQYQAQNSERIVSDSFLMSIAQEFTCKPEIIPKMFVPTCELHEVPNVHEIHSMLKQWRDGSEGTYRNLREVLDQFSVFSGRNPLTIAGIPPDHTLPEQLPQEAHKKKGHLSVHVPEDTNDEDSSSNTDSQQAIPSKREKPTLKHLQVLKGRRGHRVRVIDSVASKWEELAIALGLEECDINTVKRDYIHQAREACRTVLRMWLNGESNLEQPITWSTLIQCLIDAGFVSVAEDLDEILSSGQSIM